MTAVFMYNRLGSPILKLNGSILKPWLSTERALMTSRPVGACFKNVLQNGNPTHSARYGLELGRLIQTETCAKKAYDIARRGKVSPAVIRDAQVILSV